MAYVDPLVIPCRQCGRPKSEHSGKNHTGLCPGGGVGQRYLQVGLPARGPWLILEHCLAENHNTVHSSQAGKGRIRCICPHAVSLKKDRDRAWGETRRRDKKEEARRLLTEKANREIEAVQRIAAPRKGAGGRTPRLELAACRGQYDTVDAAYSSDRAYGAARELCGLCPVLQACDRYITDAEEPAGSWGGVWAGMSPRERAQRVVTRV